MGFYEPVLILAVIGAIYLVTRALHWRAKRRLLWLLVAAILVVGALGAGTSLLRHGSLSLPAFSD